MNLFLYISVMVSPGGSNETFFTEIVLLSSQIFACAMAPILHHILFLIVVVRAPLAQWVMSTL